MERGGGGRNKCAVVLVAANRDTGSCKSAITHMPTTSRHQNFGFSPNAGGRRLAPNAKGLAPSTTPVKMPFHAYREFQCCRIYPLGTLMILPTLKAQANAITATHQDDRSPFQDAL